MVSHSFHVNQYVHSLFWTHYQHSYLCRIFASLYSLVFVGYTCTENLLLFPKQLRMAVLWSARSRLTCLRDAINPVFPASRNNVAVAIRTASAATALEGTGGGGVRSTPWSSFPLPLPLSLWEESGFDDMVRDSNSSRSCAIRTRFLGSRVGHGDKCCGLLQCCALS